MSGLILAGIGKGIADASAAYGGGMMKMAEFEMQQEREAQREQRQLRLADQLETQKEEKRAAQAIEVEKRASEAPLKRDVSVLQGVAAKVEGESPVMSKEEMLKLIKDNPEYREVYRKAGLIGEDKMDPRLRQAVDQEAAAREVGVSSSLLESYRKAKTDTLTLIKEENKEVERKSDKEQMDRRLDIMEKGAVARQAASDAKAKNAGADKPATTADLQRQINSTKDDLALSIGATKSELNAAVASIQKKAAAGDVKAKEKMTEIQPFLDELKDANERMRQFKRVVPAGNSGDNATPPAAPTVKPVSGGGKDYSNLWK